MYDRTYRDAGRGVYVYETAREADCTDAEGQEDSRIEGETEIGVVAVVVLIV